MTQAKLHSQVSLVDHLFGLAGTISDDAEVQAHWAQYLCVRAAGLVETCVALIVTDYCQTRCSPELQRFLKSHLGRFQNANPEKIKQLLTSFEPQWGPGIDAYWDGQRRGALTSIFNNRHLIAHGKGSNVTIGRLKPWYDDTKLVIEFIRSMLFD